MSGMQASTQLARLIHRSNQRRSLARAALGLLGVFLLLAPATGGATSQVRTTDRDPVFSPNGRTIAFVRTGSTSSIMLIDTDGKNLRTLVANVPASDLAWSPDGAALAYSVDLSDIWRVDVATRATVQLTHDGQFGDWQPSWSSDGTTIAYDRFERCYRCTGIWVMDADGSNQREIAQDLGRRPIFSPTSVNELALSFTRARVIDLAGTVLVEGKLGSSYTVWSPHGTYVAYTFNGLWVENVETKKPRRISRRIGERPAWSPDGKVIAGYSKRRLALVRARDGSHFRVLPNSRAAAGAPSWGRGTVAYVHEGYCGIDLAREDGTQIRRLTRSC
jgi:Tol biopolymer transport system component